MSAATKGQNDPASVAFAMRTLTIYDRVGTVLSTRNLKLAQKKVADGARSPRGAGDARATRDWSDDDPISPPTIRSAARIHYHYFIFFLSDRAHDENKGRRVIENQRQEQ